MHGPLNVKKVISSPTRQKFTAFAVPYRFYDILPLYPTIYQKDLPSRSTD